MFRLITKKLIASVFAFAMMLTLSVMTVSASALIQGGTTYDAPATANGVTLFITDESADGSGARAHIRLNDGTIADFMPGKTVWYVALSANGQWAAAIVVDGTHGVVVRKNMLDGVEKSFDLGGNAVPALPMAYCLSNRFVTIANNGAMSFINQVNDTERQVIYADPQGVTTLVKFPNGAVVNNITGTPMIAANASVIAFTADGDNDKHLDLYAYQVATQTSVELLPQGTGDMMYSPAVNSNGTKVAVATSSVEFKGDGTMGSVQIVEVTINGGAVNQVTTSGSNWFPVYDSKTDELYYLLYHSDTQATIFRSGVDVATGDGLISVHNGFLVYHKIGEGISIGGK